MSTGCPARRRRTIVAVSAATALVACATDNPLDLFREKSAEVADDTEIRPFRVKVPEKDLVELRRRLEATRWPDPETVADSSQGVPLETMRELVSYWEKDYDWREAEEKLNAWPQYMTRIDGVDIHFLHVRSPHPDAMPLILTHGWPGSIFEFLEVIGPLTDPTAYGGSAEDAFDVVIPSMPGYGFSGRPKEAGWGADKIASAWVELMERLGYDQFVAQGGDWGAIISQEMARQEPAALLGIHINMPAVVPQDVSRALKGGEPAPEGLSEEERVAYEALATFYREGTGYSAQMGTRPQTVGYSLADSPVGLAAWLYDKIDDWTFHRGEAERSLPREAILDNITLYWLTNTGTSAARLYWETPPTFDAMEISIPVAVTVFPGEIYRAPRSWAERTYHDLIYWNEVEEGGHFAAWEEPEIFVSEVRAALRSLRQPAIED